MRPCLYCLVLATLVATLPAPASAVDGVLEINQACAAVGCFPGDAPEFPVTIARSQTGSYRLTSNLVNLDPDVTTIEIDDSHVTLDLNGFGLSGPTVCTGIGTGLSCLPSGSGYGILASAPDGPIGIVVKNGVVRGSPNGGIWMGGNDHRIEGVHVVSNGGMAIDVGFGAVVGGCRVVRNGTGGIDAWAGVVRGNIVVGNGGETQINGGVIAKNVIRENGLGLRVLIGTDLIVDNTVTDNGSHVSLTCCDGYARNVFRGNGGTGPQLSGGVEIGRNLCGTNTTCP